MRYNDRKLINSKIMSRLINPISFKKMNTNLLDNRTLNIAQKKIIQLIQIPWGNIKDQPINIPITKTGAQPVNMVINQYAGRNGTFHHIYPKSELTRPLMQIEKVYTYYNNSTRNGSKADDVKKLIKLRNILITNGNNANGYYWNPGTGFGGFAPEFRTDNSENAPEPNAPKGMDKDVFKIAKETRPNSLKKILNEIENNKLEASSIDDCEKNEKALKSRAIYNTINTDWIVKKGFEGDFGQPKKIYSIKK